MPKIVKLTMQKTKKGSFDPYRSFCFKAGKTVNVPSSLARRFIEEGAAKVFEIEEKDIKINNHKKKLKKLKESE